MEIVTRIAQTFPCDVLVCGGGCAGFAAALSSARNGADTILVERAPFAGGIITCVGLPFFDGMHEKKTGRVVVRGIALELAAKIGICSPKAKSLDDFDPRYVEREYGICRIPNIENFKHLADRELQAAPHLKVFFHSMACEAVTQNGRIARVLVANKDGLIAIEPKMVIDATGDADVAAFSGSPVEKNPPLQPMTLHFRIGNVKAKHSEINPAAREQCEKAMAAGELKSFYGPGFGFPFADDEVYVHAVRVPADGTDAADLTRAEMQGRADVQVMFERWKKHVPGFENSYLISTGPFIGVRETRSIVGHYVLTENDILQQKKFDDAIATGCWYLDRHANEATPGAAQKTPMVYPGCYDIPYRSLVAKGADNLLVAGRCHSATKVATSSTRVTATAMAMGEAAGVAAALAVKHKCGAAEVSVSKLREALARQNAGIAE